MVLILRKVEVKRGGMVVEGWQKVGGGRREVGFKRDGIARMPEAWPVETGIFFLLSLC